MTMRLPRLQNPSAAVYVIPAIIVVGGIAYLALREPKKTAKRPAAPAHPTLPVPGLTGSRPTATIRPDLLVATQLQPKTSKGGGGGPPAKSTPSFDGLLLPATLQQWRRDDLVPNISGNASGWNPPFFGKNTVSLFRAGLRSKMLALGYPMDVFSGGTTLSYDEQMAVADFQNDWNAVIAALDDRKLDAHPLFINMRGLLESQPGSLATMTNLISNEKATLRAIEISSVADSSFDSPEMKWRNLVEIAKS